MPDTSSTAPAFPVARCWTVHGPAGACDVEVVAAEGAALADVLPALGRLLGVGAPALWSGSGRLAPDLPLSAPALDE